MSKIAGSESGSISQRHGSADPDPHKNVMDPQHWVLLLYKVYIVEMNAGAPYSLTYWLIVKALAWVTF
jgi:hypothetical protein